MLPFGDSVRDPNIAKVIRVIGRRILTRIACTHTSAHTLAHTNLVICLGLGARKSSVEHHAYENWTSYGKQKPAHRFLHSKPGMAKECQCANTACPSPSLPRGGKHLRGCTCCNAKQLLDGFDLHHPFQPMLAPFDAGCSEYQPRAPMRLIWAYHADSGLMSW